VVQDNFSGYWRVRVETPDNVKCIKTLIALATAGLYIAQAQMKLIIFPCGNTGNKDK
jgi:hypothetical protein